MSLAWSPDNVLGGAQLCVLYYFVRTAYAIRTYRSVATAMHDRCLADRMRDLKALTLSRVESAVVYVCSARTAEELSCVCIRLSELFDS